MFVRECARLLDIPAGFPFSFPICWPHEANPPPEKNTTMTSVSFQVQDYLAAELPDYANEIFHVIILLLAAALIWILVIPALLSRPHDTDGTAAKRGDGSPTAVDAAARTRDKTTSVKVAVAMGSGKSKKHNKQKGTTKADNNNNKTNNNSSSSQNERAAPDTPKAALGSEGTPRHIPLWANMVSMAGLLITSVLILLTWSPYNYYLPRRVFQAPLLTPEECQRVVAMATRAAQRNAERAAANSTATADNNPLLQEPIGWQKARHGTYPTTDLNLVTDPFTKGDLEWLQDLFDRRLAPSLERFYGIPPAAIRMNDLFVVRYDAVGGMRTHLARHTDNADISFNVLLTEDFEGGGTRFWDRRRPREPFAHVTPSRAGTFLAHGAQINHDGYHVTKGTRMILVGFTNVDRFDPWTGRGTGLTLWASWFSVPWFHIRCRAGYLRSHERMAEGTSTTTTTKMYDSRFVRLLFRDLIHILEMVGDYLAPHAVTTVVDPSKNATDYLRALDDEYRERGRYKPKANWFKGQNVKLEVVSDPVML